MKLLTTLSLLFLFSLGANAQIYGCTDSNSCTYDPDATNSSWGDCFYLNLEGDCINCLNSDINDNGICDISEGIGCNDPDACNYHPNAILGDGSCEYPAEGFDCFGNWSDWWPPDCDEPCCGPGYQIAGCMDEVACNYNPAACDEPEGYCIYPEIGFDCEGIPNPCESNFNGDSEISITDALMLFSEWGCTSDCTTDIDGDGIVSMSDLFQLLIEMGNTCAE